MKERDKERDRGSVEMVGRSRSFSNMMRDSPTLGQATPRHSSSDILIPAFSSNSITDVYDREGEYFRILIQVSHPSQLFVSYDPSPIYRKQVREDIEDYIVDCVEDVGGADRARIVVVLPSEFDGTEEIENICSAMVNFFKYRELQKRRLLRTTLRQGRKSLIAGSAILVLFLLMSAVLTQVATKWWPDYSWISDTFGQVLVVSGWVAMWEPVTLLLHTWRPIYDDIKQYRRISTIETVLEFQRTDEELAASAPPITQPMFSFGKQTMAPTFRPGLMQGSNSSNSITVLQGALRPPPPTFRSAIAAEP